MDPPSIDLEDYTCSICREIFQSPVSLSCPHSYCQNCVIGLRKHASTSSTSESNPVSSFRGESSSHSKNLHQHNKCFVCAICRKESLGYVRYIDLENQLKTLKAPCPHCSTILTLSELRYHLETCVSTKSQNHTNREPKTIAATLSESQAAALKRAQAGDNRSTFQCPFCPRANFTLSHLRQHIKARHLHEDQHRVCPICSSMPWGDKNMVSSNVYQHIMSRHQFDYDTYVNYEQDEVAMMREALRASMFDQ